MNNSLGKTITWIKKKKMIQLFFVDVTSNGKKGYINESLFFKKQHQKTKKESEKIKFYFFEYMKQLRKKKVNYKKKFKKLLKSHPGIT